MGGVRAAAAAAALLTAALPTASPAQMRQHHRLTHQPASTPPPHPTPGGGPPHAEKGAGRPQRTVMSWVTADPSGSAHHPWNLTADFVLHGPARGAVNANYSVLNDERVRRQRIQHRYNDIVKQYSMCRNHVDDTTIYRLIELIEKYKNEKHFTNPEKEEYKNLVNKIKKQNVSILKELFRGEMLTRQQQYFTP